MVPSLSKIGREKPRRALEKIIKWDLIVNNIYKNLIFYLAQFH